MTALDRTAYPYFKQVLSPEELAAFYTPTVEELVLARARVRRASNRLSFLVLLKSFQRLGYFPQSDVVPVAVIDHICKHLNLAKTISPVAPEGSCYRYYQIIRTYLQVKSYDTDGEQVATAAIETAVTVMDHPADLINVAIEALVKESYELPAFSTLDRLAGHLRALNHTLLFEQVCSQLNQDEQDYLDGLITQPMPETRAFLNQLKAPPQKESLKHFANLQRAFDELMSFGDTQRQLNGVTTTKIKYLAAYAKTLDIAEFQDINLAKRRTLLLCLLYRAQVTMQDNLVEMFLKRMRKIDANARKRLLELREQHLARTERLLGLFSQTLTLVVTKSEALPFQQSMQRLLAAEGGAEELLAECEELRAYNSQNHLSLMWRFYAPYRKVLFKLVRILDIRSTSEDSTLMDAMAFVLAHQEKRRKYLPMDIDVSFISGAWRQLVISTVDGEKKLVRQHLEVCIFAYLAVELINGDAFVTGSEEYADFRQQLLSWDDCEPLVANYCDNLGIPATAAGLIEKLQATLKKQADEVDVQLQVDQQISFNDDGDPVLKRVPAAPVPKDAEAFMLALSEKMPERTVLDILGNVEHWLHWTRHLGPLSGSEPKLADATERYILTTFAYGCNLGPNQTARHLQGQTTAHQLSYTSRRHISIEALQVAIRDIVNAYHRLQLPKCWGTGDRAAADGSKFETYENNLRSEYHIRYRGYGGIAYHHVSDQYIALFTHFISCAVWEAVYILDGLIKNTSDIQPGILHGDTQGQSSPVFGLSFLLGIELMPRIRNWHDLKLLKPTVDNAYELIEPLFKGVPEWALIQTHWKDLMRVVLSIKAGKLMPSTLLRKLNSYSRKNRLYKAFQALGNVIRTLFLLRYVSEPKLRQQITACTNKVEQYHQFLDWVFFAKAGLITDNDPVEQEKRLKFLELVADAIILQNTVDLSQAIQALNDDGYPITPELLAGLSPYLTKHIKRYGDYFLDLLTPPSPLEEIMALPFLSLSHTVVSSTP
ncbi:Tn3 family transposase [Synechocystis sp. LEGE 06083]|jgi:TnpA family transposase|uniref:Tn3 family transposase n=1 Tax=Synechocystis sp. LEGE 06083 TaxID=915336 RepID=UPI00188214F3|nr:Tn3 family transposase [Synechocystis sp. LEGE 06083]MBE9193783.1 Tn3 family transposase [Synechocystis sp. LEGE 06083]